MSRVHLVVCSRHGACSVDLDGPEEMCDECRVVGPEVAPSPPEPRIGSLDDARYWIAVLHRRSIQDAETHNELRERIRALEEKPWRYFMGKARRRAGSG